MPEHIAMLFAGLFASFSFLRFSKKDYPVACLGLVALFGFILIRLIL